MEDITAMSRLMFYAHPKYEREWWGYQARMRRWKARGQPQRFRLWVAWLVLHPLVWVLYRLRHWWYWRNRKKVKVGGFTGYMFPAIKAPMPDIRSLLSVQPMTRETAQVFYINHLTAHDGEEEEPKPHWTTKWWAWGCRRPHGAGDYWQVKSAMSWNFKRTYGGSRTGRVKSSDPNLANYG